MHSEVLPDGQQPICLAPEDPELRQKLIDEIMAAVERDISEIGGRVKSLNVHLIGEVNARRVEDIRSAVKEMELKTLCELHGIMHNTRGPDGRGRYIPRAKSLSEAR